MDTDESLFHATPQTRGRIAHKSIDNKSANKRQSHFISSLFSKIRINGKHYSIRSEQCKTKEIWKCNTS